MHAWESEKLECINLQMAKMFLSLPSMQELLQLWRVAERQLAWRGHHGSPYHLRDNNYSIPMGLFILQVFFNNQQSRQA